MTQKERERDVEIQEKRWEREKVCLERELNIKKERKELVAKYKSKTTTSKLLILFLFLNCTLIELFTGVVILKSFDLATMTMMAPDLSPLVALIGAVVSEVIGFAIYALKSTKENTAGGIVYETALAQFNSEGKG